MDKLTDSIFWGVKLWILTIVIPLALTIMNILFVGIFVVETIYGFWENLRIIWIDYYITGSFLDIAAWRIHLGLIFMCVVFMFFQDE